MINVRLQIEDGKILDTFDAYGLIYKESDNRTEAPIKARESSSYAEEAGEHIDPRTLQDAFDYKVKFILLTPHKNLKNANVAIDKFNKLLYTQQADSDVRIYKEVAFFNDFKHVKIVGLPEPIAQPTNFYPGREDCTEVEFVIRVSDPTKCDFNLSEL